MDVEGKGEVERERDRLRGVMGEGESGGGDSKTKEIGGYILEISEAGERRGREEEKGRGREKEKRSR